MSDKEKEIATMMAEALKKLPPEKKERWVGYAEGVLDMAERQQTDRRESA